MIEKGLEMMGRKGWRGGMYGVVKRNCNCFSRVFAGWLVGEGRVGDLWPRWVDRVAGVGRGVIGCLGGGGVVDVGGDGVGGGGWRVWKDEVGRKWYVRRGDEGVRWVGVGEWGRGVVLEKVGRLRKPGKVVVDEKGFRRESGCWSVSEGGSSGMSLDEWYDSF